MNLYRIDFAHWAPKDREDGIKGYVLAENAEKVYHYIDKEYCYDSMEEHEADRISMNGDDEDSWNDWEDWGSYKDKMIDLGGQLNDENHEIDDLYYGVTLHGWELVKEDVEIKDFEEAINLNIIKHI
jgi:hypothetical protein